MSNWLSLLIFLVATNTVSTQFSGDEDIDDYDNDDGDGTITILGLFPFTQLSYDTVYSGPGEILQASVELALEEISREKSLLKGYRLRLQADNSGCDIVRTSYYLIRHAYVPLQPVVVLGPQCDNPATLMGKMVNPNNSLIAVSYGARTIDLVDSNAYSRFFRTLTPYSGLSRALARLLVKFNWNRICVLIQSENSQLDLANDFLQYLEGNPSLNITPLHVVTENNVEFLIGGFCRVFVAFAEPYVHSLVSCLSHQAGLTGAEFQTIFIGEFVTHYNWTGQMGCYTPLNESAQSVMSVHFQSVWDPYYPNEDEEDNSDGSGYGADYIIDYDDFDHRVRIQLFRQRLHSRLSFYFNGSKNIPYFDYVAAAAAYEAAWMIAYGLNSSIEALAKYNWTLKHYLPIFTPAIAQIIVDEFEKVSFQGIYKNISFSSDRHHPYEDIIISQYQEDRFVQVASYNEDDNQFREVENVSYQWIGAGPPSDRPVEIKVDYTDISLILISVTLLGLVLCMIFFIFNCAYRKQKVIKASSPMINNIIISGCAMIFISISTFMFSNSFATPVILRDTFCNVTIWLVFCGFTLSFGSLTIKTWRVYRVYKNPWSQRRTYRESFLYALIGIMLASDLLILVIMVATYPLKFMEESIYTTEYTYTYPVCMESLLSSLFTDILIIIKVLVIVIAGFLAAQTRNIESKAFNDSKWIAMAIYLIIVLCLFGLPLTIISVFSGALELAYACVIALLALIACIILLTVFVPKIFLFVFKRDEPVTTTTAISSTYYAAARKSVISINSRREAKL